MYGAYGELNPNIKITREIAELLWIYFHSSFDFPIIQRKRFIGKFNITVDIYKKLQSKKTWKHLEKELDLSDLINRYKVINFLKLILSEAQ